LILDETISCGVCGTGLLLKELCIDNLFLSLLGKYEGDIGCVIELDGSDHDLTAEDKLIEFALVPSSGRLVTTIKIDLPMVISSLS
jgi:hypothetical protein